MVALKDFDDFAAPAGCSELERLRGVKAAADVQTLHSERSARTAPNLVELRPADSRSFRRFRAPARANPAEGGGRFD